MLKNNKLLWLILPILIFAFSLPVFATDYTYTQQSGAGFKVASPDKSDALEDTNEVRQIVNDLGTLLGHTKMDGTYPKDLTTGGTLSAFDLYYLITQINTQAKMEAIWGVALVNDGDLASYQPLDTALTNLSGLTYVSPSFIKLTADDTYAVRTLTEVKTDLSLNLVENLKVKLDATEAPAAATDDITLGYAVGSRWVDITNDKEYVCLDNTDGSAVWTETTGAGGSSTFTGLTDTPADYTGSANKFLQVNATPDALVFDTISSDDLSDVASIAMLDEAETVTGYWYFTDHFNIDRSHDDDWRGPNLMFFRKRDGDPTSLVSPGDTLGYLSFQGYIADADIYSEGAQIRGVCDGVSAQFDSPGRLEFLTTPDGDYEGDLRMAIDNAGNIKMGDGTWTNYINITSGGDMTAEGTASVKATDLDITSQSAGDILYFDGTNWIRLAKGTAGQVLTMNAGATAPEWQTP